MNAFIVQHYTQTPIHIILYYIHMIDKRIKENLKVLRTNTTTLSSIHIHNHIVLPSACIMYIKKMVTLFNWLCFRQCIRTIQKIENNKYSSSQTVVGCALTISSVYSKPSTDWNHIRSSTLNTFRTKYTFFRAFLTKKENT